MLSPAFAAGGLIPLEYTGRGEDISPPLLVHGLLEETVTLAITMDDLDHPLPAYNHWLIWNLPPNAEIVGGIPAGPELLMLGGARQGRAYGKHRYRGPKPPFNWSHRYRFTVYALDCRLDLPPTSRKKALLQAMQGHILQQGELIGHFR